MNIRHLTAQHEVQPSRHVSDTGCGSLADILGFVELFSTLALSLASAPSWPSKDQALHLFAHMRTWHLEMNEMCCTAAMSACEKSGHWETCQKDCVIFST